jgi:hypothetical protein
MEVAEKYSASVGQPLAVAASAPLSARTFAYATVRPECRGDGCFATEGFRTPYPGVHRDYWRESPASAALELGFTLAKEKEPAPTLIVETTDEGDLLAIRMELRAADGRTLSKGIARYRSGFSGEPADQEAAVGTSRPARMAVHYLLHANTVNRSVGARVAQTVAYPVRTFLQRATALAHPQDASFATSAITPQTLAAHRFDPPRVLRGGDAERSAFFFDQERNDRCLALLRKESEGPVMQGWWLFVQDPTGQRKARVTGPRICDADSIWFFDYASLRGHVVLTKFGLQGNVVYRVSIKRPGEQTFIREPSLRSSGGMLEFEWVTGDHAGKDFHVTAIDAVRAEEPRQ